MDTEVKNWLAQTIKELFADWPFKPEVNIVEEERSLTAEIRTGKDFMFIQPTAQPLFALQHLLRLMLKNKFPETTHKLLVDIGNFRDQQLAALGKVVKEAAWQAKASGNSVHLSPMSSFERRLVHMQIADESDLTSESTGVGAARHVVIKLNAK